MTEPAPTHQTDKTASNSRLPRRAWNLAMRVLELEKQCNRRGRLTVDIIFIDGEWLIGVNRPVELERLGDS